MKFPFSYNRTRNGNSSGTYNRHVTRMGSLINIHAMNDARVITEFLLEVKDGIREKITAFDLLIDNNKVYPNVAVPIAGIIDCYRRNRDIAFNPVAPDSYGIFAPQQASSVTTGRLLGKVIRFDSSDANLLSQMYVADMRKSDEFHAGMLEALELSLNEVFDNVIQYSQQECGFVMGQLHPERKNIAFTVYDYGQGILNSFAQSPDYHPATDIDAITMAIKEGVTSGRGQGNGLYILYSMVENGKGVLSITSSRGRVTFDHGMFKTGTSNTDRWETINRQNASTSVEFILNYSEDLRLIDTLKVNGRGIDFVDLFMQGMECEDGTSLYVVREKGDGTGTREAAQRSFNEIVNIIRTTRRPVVLDFKGVSVITNSYADQLISQLLMRFGLFRFNKLIRLENLSETNERLLQRSVIQRILREYSKDREGVEDATDER